MMRTGLSYIAHYGAPCKNVHKDDEYRLYNPHRNFQVHRKENWECGTDNPPSNDSWHRANHRESCWLALHKSTY